jgi:hypothetical protein
MQIEKGFTDNRPQPTGAQENLMRQYVASGSSGIVPCRSSKPPLRERKHYEEENWETETN